MLAWLRAFAAAVGTSASWEKIRNAAVITTDARPAKTTTLPYVKLLTALRILDPLPAWSSTLNHLRDLTESPKHYLVDPALAARLVKRNATQLLAGNMPDTVVPRDGGYSGVGIEVKLNGAVGDSDVKHLLWLRGELGEQCIDTVVLHTGPQAYRRPDGVAVVPLTLLGP